MKLVFSPLLLLVSTASALKVSTSDLGGNSVTGMKFVNRLYVPYGPDPDADPTAQPWTGYGYGTGSTEHYAYDWKEGYIYSQSEVGAYITVIDWCTLPGSVSEYSLNLESEDSEIKDVVVCPEEGLLFLSSGDANKVKMYETVKRDKPAQPKFLKDIDVGNSPDALKVSSDCSVLAVANQNEGITLKTKGAMAIVTDFRGAAGPVVKNVDLGGFTDDELISNDVHMPLTKNAMIYWDQHSANEDFMGEWTDLINDGYDPTYFLDPEFIAFSHDNSEIYLNLQDNSAIARIDVATAEVTKISGMGLKSFASNGIDIVKDDESCDLFVNDSDLYTTFAPDGIASVNIDGTEYIFTADEGSDLDFGDYEEKYDSNDLFTSVSTLGLVGFSWKDGSPLTGLAKSLSNDCDTENGGDPWCSNLEITIGSSAVDYSDPAAPVINKIVGIGGRGMSIMEVPSNPDDKIQLKWTSGDEFEKKGCAAFPWAHNALQDEEFAPLDGDAYKLGDEDTKEDIEAMNDPDEDGCEAEDGLKGLPGACPMSKTVDEKSPEDGLGVESVVLGVACSTLVAVACGENNSNCYLYDVSNINSPNLIEVFNLSPASETQNPGYAYKQKTLGDIDAETTTFVEGRHSPTGKPGILFGGAISGTLSFWEFKCSTEVAAEKRETTCSTGTSAEEESKAGLSGGAIAGIAIGTIVGVGIIAGLAFTSKKKSPPPKAAAEGNNWIDDDAAIHNGQTS